MKNIVLVLVLLLGSTALASAAETFQANLRPRDGVASNATGSATLVLSDTEDEITFEITLAGLSSAELAAHVHRADGDIVFDLPLGNSKVGVWQNPGPLELFQLREGLLFVLVHTADHPGGEIRGDLSSTTVSTAESTVGELKRRYE